MLRLQLPAGLCLAKDQPVQGDFKVAIVKKDDSISLEADQTRPRRGARASAHAVDPPRGEPFTQIARH